MKKLMIASASAVMATCVFGDGLAADIATGFEGTYATPTQVGGYDDNGLQGVGDIYWLQSAAQSTAVATYSGSEVTAAPDKQVGSSTVTAGNKFLNLATDGGTLWRAFTDQRENEATEPAGSVDVGTATYIDTMVQFTATEGDTTPTLGANDKLAIWLKADDTSTNLVVRTKSIERAGYVPSTGAYVEGAWSYEEKTVALGGYTGTIEPDHWYRLTVKAVNSLASVADADVIPGFMIYLDGTALVASEQLFADSGINYLNDNGEGGFDAGWVSEENIKLVRDKKFIPSLQGCLDAGVAATLSGVGFQGEGKIDNLLLTTTDPLAVPEYGFTITVASGVSAEWSKDNGTTWTAYATGAKAPANSSILIRLTTNDGGVKTCAALTLNENDTEFDTTEETFGWPEYLGPAVEGAYTIDSKEDLLKLAAKYADLGTAGITFKQTVDIALTDVWYGIGAFNAKDNIGKPDVYTNSAFKGTYDGGNHTVSGVILHCGDYVGFFGSTYDATIRNLKLSLGNATGFDGNTGDYGGALVCGVSTKTTIENCQTVVAGEYTGMTANKALAGIVGFAGKGTTVKGCVNNLSITTSNEKSAGIIAISQDGSNVYADFCCVIESCTNNAAVTCTTSGKTAAAGIISYVNNAITIKGANVNTGAIKLNNGSVDGCSIATAYGEGGVITVAEGATFTVQAGIKAYGGYAADKSAAPTACNGLNFATVSGDTATLVKNSAAVNGANLKVMSAGAAVTLANVGDSITLDESLATATVTTTDTEANEVVKSGDDNPYTYTVQAKTIAVTGVTLNETVTNVTVGSSVTLVATVAPENASDKTVTWESEDANIATVENGVVTGVAAGTVRITATAGGFTAICTVTVEAASKPEIEPGETSVDVKADSADDATNKVVMVAPTAEGLSLSNEEYKEYFTFTATETSPGSGTYTVTATLDAEKIDLDETVADVAGDGIEAVLGVDGGKVATVTIDAKPGLWYSTSVVSDLSTADAKAWADGEGSRELAKGNTVQMSITRPSSGNAAFIKVMVNTTDK